eukprot:COSAG02_NODE_150_length_33596_cov_61.953966_10_plen_249_part_00
MSDFPTLFRPQQSKIAALEMHSFDSARRAARRGPGGGPAGVRAMHATAAGPGAGAPATHTQHAHWSSLGPAEMTTESGSSLPLLSAGVVASVVALGVPAVCAAGAAIVASTPSTGKSTGRGRRRRVAVVSSSSDSEETDETSDGSSTSESDTGTGTETESNTRTSHPRGSATTDSCPPYQRNLMACHKQLQKHCSEQNRAFMACKAQHADPRACAHLGCAEPMCYNACCMSVLACSAGRASARLHHRA